MQLSFSVVVTSTGGSHFYAQPIPHAQKIKNLHHSIYTTRGNTSK